MFSANGGVNFSDLVTEFKKKFIGISYALNLSEVRIEAMIKFFVNIKNICENCGNRTNSFTSDVLLSISSDEKETVCVAPGLPGAFSNWLGFLSDITDSVFKRYFILTEMIYQTIIVPLEGTLSMIRESRNYWLILVSKSEAEYAISMNELSRTKSILEDLNKKFVKLRDQMVNENKPLKKKKLCDDIVTILGKLRQTQLIYSENEEKMNTEYKNLINNISNACNSLIKVRHDVTREYYTLLFPTATFFRNLSFNDAETASSTNLLSKNNDFSVYIQENGIVRFPYSLEHFCKVHLKFDDPQFTPPPLSTFKPYQGSLPLYVANCIQDFNAEHNNEISVRKYQKIYIFETPALEWVCAYDPVAKNRGYIPSSILSIDNNQYLVTSPSLSLKCAPGEIVSKEIDEFVTITGRRGSIEILPKIL